MNLLDPVVVIWETSDLPYPRDTGSFNTNVLWAWIWGQVFCFFNPRGAVRVELIRKG